MKHILTLAVAVFSAMALVPAAACGKDMDNPFVFGNARLTLITDGLLRMEYAVDGRFNDDRTMFAWNRDSLSRNYTVEQVDSLYIIRTPVMTIRYVDDGYPFGIFNLNVEFDNGGHRTVWNTRKSAFPSPQNLSGAVSTLDQVNGRCPLEEGIRSRDGYYMVDDTGSDRISMDTGWLYSPKDGNVIQDYYLFVYGTDYKSALKSLGAISGHAPMSRKYMHGVWYCRFHKYSADDYRRIAEEYDGHGFPLDVMAFDMDWHTMDAKYGSGHGGRMSWTGYTWNRELFPDPEGIIREFAQKGIAVTLNDHPADGMRSNEEYWPEFMQSLGLDPDADRCPIYDASDSSYMKSIFRYAHGPREKEGVAFWWIDWQQNYIQPYVRGTRTRHTAWLNHLYYMHSLDSGNLRGNIYSRWGGMGSQRYPIQFSGDVYASWESLAFQVEMTATSSNAGCFFWAHDIGGHYNDVRDEELYVRWTQFGALSSTLRVHSSGPMDRRPWLYGSWAEDAMRKAYHLRSRLMPYIYSSVRQTHEQMLPLIRAMYIGYPEEEDAYHVPQQYMLGDHLIVAPVTSPGAGPDRTAGQEVWLPSGDRWYDFFSGKGYDGGQTIHAEADIDEIPLFVRGGILLPMQPYTPRMGTAQTDTLVCHVYPAGRETSSSTVVLYEDDGLTREYMDGAYAKTPLSCVLDNGVLGLEVGPASGTFNGQLPERTVVFRIHGTGDNARVSGRGIDTVKAEEDGITVTMKKSGIRKECAITLTNPYN